MINVILSLLFLIFMMIFLYSTGNLFIKNTLEENFSLKLITGFLILCTVEYITNMIAQLFAINWNLYFWINTIVLLIYIVIALVVMFKKKIKLWDLMNKKNLMNILRENWFLCLLVLFFTILSISNLQPYYLNNYQDDHYIVKVVHLIGTKSLLNENYYNGNLLQWKGLFSYAIQQNQKVFNTYELMYSYFSTLFHINPVFFCRFTITAFNYIITFLSYKLFASLFLKKSESQYSLIVFCILLLPSGYLAKGNLPITIRFWENWRFQTAMYMGGTMVRVCALPLNLYFINYWLSNKNIKRFLLIIAVNIALLSYQTTAFTYIVMLILILILSCLIEALIQNRTNFVRLVLILAVLVVYTAVLFNLNQLFSRYNFSIKSSMNFITNSTINIKKIAQMSIEYNKYYRDALTYDFIFRSSFLPLILLLLIEYKNRVRRIIFMISSIYIFLLTNKSSYFMCLISLKSFNAGRFLSSTQMILFIIWGVTLIKYISLIPFKKFNYNILVESIISIFLATGMIIHMKYNYKNILKYNSAGDSIVSQGYSIKTFFSNDDYIPEPINKICKYFNNQISSNNKVLVYCPEYLHIDGIKIGNRSLLMGSKKIKFTRDWNIYSDTNLNLKKKYVNSANWILNEFIYNKNNKYVYHNYETCKKYIDKANLKYIITDQQSVKRILVKNGWKQVVGSNQKNYWLLIKE